MKSRKQIRRITAIALVIGILVFSVSALANYVTAGGYESAKNAVKNLLFDTQNVSLKAEMKITQDGVLRFSTVYDMKSDGRDASTIVTEVSPEIVYDSDPVGTLKSDTYSTFVSHEYLIGDKRCSYNSNDDDTYYLEARSNETILPLLEDNTLNRRMVRFGELLADTVVGDLQNHITLVGRENGNRTYAATLTENQLPELVTSGMNVIASLNAVNNGADYGYTDYKDMDATFAAWYAKRTGEKLPEDIDNIVNNMPLETADEKNLYDAYWNLRGEMQEEYDALVETGKVVRVAPDGSYRIEDNTAKSDDFFLGDTIHMDVAEGSFTVDSSDRVVSGEGTATFITEFGGEKHTFTMEITVSATDYGCTTIDTPDLTGREMYDYDSAEYKYADEYNGTLTETDVHFDGKDYHVRYYKYNDVTVPATAAADETVEE